MILSVSEKNLCAQDLETALEKTTAEAWSEAREMLLETIQSFDLKELKMCVLSGEQISEIDDAREDELVERAREIASEEIEEARFQVVQQIKDFVDGIN